MDPIASHPRASTRPATAVAITLICFASSGATCVRPWVANQPPPPQVLAAGATVDEIITAVHANTTRISSVLTDDATISIAGVSPMGTPPLVGRIAIQPARRLRLTAGTRFLGTEVDLGSNDELFWLWVKRNDPPAVYFARHDQFPYSPAAQQLGIEPSWLIQALGMTTFDINEIHNGPTTRPDGSLEIRSTWQSPRGQMTRLSVIDGATALVKEQHMFDANGTLIGSAIARSHRYFPEHQASLPQVIEIQWPANRLTLTVNMGHVLLNQSSVGMETLFQMPTFGGEERIDLAGHGPRPPGVSPPTSPAGPLSRRNRPRT